MTDHGFQEHDEFLPLREPGPHMPSDTVEELDIFRLFFDDDTLERLVASTNAYAESKKEQKPLMYLRFKQTPLTKEEMMRYIGALLLLSISSTRSYRQAWNVRSSQVLVRLLDLMSRNRFETISAFFHVVTIDEEVQLAGDPLKKIRPLHNKIKVKCLEFYQPLRELSIDERIVKSKARTHFRQYIRNKPTKWGFKYWVLADPTGYTVDFNLYCGKQRTIPLSGQGLAYDVVMELVQPFQLQGYLLFIDNFYTSPALLPALKELGIGTTGTLNISRREVPESVRTLAKALNRSDVPRGTGSSNVYVCWRDKKCVTVLSNSYPGHADGTAKRRSKDHSGSYSMLDVPMPSTVKHYNQFMGGVDLSDQLIGYHRLLRQTKKYWKTLLYHLLEVAITIAFVLYKWQLMMKGARFPSESQFRDQVVLSIIRSYSPAPDPLSYPLTYTVQHGSKAFAGDSRRCCYCQKRTRRYCPDCPFGPVLCQYAERDCHGEWHSPVYSVKRHMWFVQRKQRLMRTLPTEIPAKRRGRPMGMKDKKKRKKRTVQ